MEKTVHKAYKFRFYPQQDLKLILANTFGCARFVYNQTLAFSENHFKSRFLDNDKTLLNPDYKPLSNENRIKFVKKLKCLTDNEGNLLYPWLSEVSSVALQ